MEGHDQSWDLELTIQTVKKLTPNFSPGKKRKAAYSDTNYQLLGTIIEIVTKKSIDEVFKESLFDKLGLRHTYVYKDLFDNAPVPFYYKSKKLWLPKYLVSIPSEGGIVSTAEESMLFLKEFFNGIFFQKRR
ncbi:serine hydrolase [Anaerobacillus isosaccharinicus]|uniref:Serine hydrolase n=1 Tax=Anaerobacillus isosaccharinicus TaxID=1532552 RepID=A0AC62A4A2_9BACI